MVWFWFCPGVLREERVIDQNLMCLPGLEPKCTVEWQRSLLTIVHCTLRPWWTEGMFSGRGIDNEDIWGVNEGRCTKQVMEKELPGKESQAKGEESRQV